MIGKMPFAFLLIAHRANVTHNKRVCYKIITFPSYMICGAQQIAKEIGVFFLLRLTYVMNF